MEKKISLKICVGTYCYVMGGNDLRSIKSRLPEDIKNKVYVEASICLGCDAKGIEPQPPYVEINGELIGGATDEIIIDKIRTLI